MNRFKTLSAITMIAFYAFALWQCSDESAAPKPVEKTELEIIQEDIIGTWTYETAKITVDGQTTDYTSGQCMDVVNGVYALDVDYSFQTEKGTMGNKVEFENNCAETVGQNKSYTVTEKDDVFYVNIFNSAVFERSYEIVSTTKDSQGTSMILKTTSTKHLGGVDYTAVVVITYRKK